ncbi:hypothetical protein HO133_006290 [Letharia lupina]|uniref:Uncharacterized protein n=1 Tax=Letharia lupina TaxID=560253 RepID=A0A8H6F7S4_9LECA|nr:uncharacterized protein HO133_006290 [Letharia lupina]KAF6217878.1 hypothetical protein HO133_006290 [Letharia lupina]
MPKGQKLIDWTPENDAKLMLTILVVENIYPNCEKVAAAFGSDSSSIRKTSAKSQKVLTGRVTKARTPGKKNAKSNVMISGDAEVEVGDNEFDDVIESRAEDGDEFEKKIALRIKKEDVD